MDPLSSSSFHSRLDDPYSFPSSTPTTGSQKNMLERQPISDRVSQAVPWQKPTSVSMQQEDQLQYHQQQKRSAGDQILAPQGGGNRPQEGRGDSQAHPYSQSMPWTQFSRTPPGPLPAPPPGTIGNPGAYQNYRWVCVCGCCAFVSACMGVSVCACHSS